MQVIDLGTYAGADYITAGPNGSGQSWQGDVWVTERGDNEIVRIDTLDSGGGSMMPAAMPSQGNAAPINGVAAESANGMVSLSAGDLAPGMAAGSLSVLLLQPDTPAPRSAHAGASGTDVSASSIAAMPLSPIASIMDFDRRDAWINPPADANHSDSWLLDQDTDFAPIVIGNGIAF